MATGLWRDGKLVRVSYFAAEAISISRSLYEERGYRPTFDELPTREAFEASRSAKT